MVFRPFFFLKYLVFRPYYTFTLTCNYHCSKITIARIPGFNSGRAGDKVKKSLCWLHRAALGGESLEMCGKNRNAEQF